MPKAHQHACNVTDKQAQGIGKSVAGDTSQILMADAYANPLQFIVPGEQVHDVKIISQVGR